MSKPELYTLRETAKTTGYCGKYLRDLLYEDRIPGAKKVEGKWVLPASAVEALKARKQK